ncbi:hydroxyacylglutathione hydrolase [Sulfuriferula plumbiphila]|uniref:Hydroxyacylglutathione hydrolase n=1 Tax=Sulfuriferula plumbiphila TaxID=171865 RepID=A0A512L7Z7_9PROT|nr:hydroxyacylglutathione hydrolase [Sulfuriferula plumbiphila]BBP04556.1 hydroxyacylglutathione hydrolase [Sulfuriferula plumbiphila]GEP30582.1 hydroxyacylglutathione hydrolase [Sulfuriferula plumbiphila]
MHSDIYLAPVRAFADNYIWVIHRDACAVVVDPGDARPVMQFLRDKQLRLVAILTTHHHADHTGGNLALLAHYPVPVYGPASENIPGITRPLRDGDTVSLPELMLDLSVLEVPGHTAGHIAYYGTASLLCGDTLFAAGCGRLFEGTPAQMAASLARLAQLPDDTAVYCAHEYTLANIAFALSVDGNNPALIERARIEQDKRAAGLPTLPSSIGLEKATNPFLRCHATALREAAESWAGKSLPDDLAVFAALREMKNGFRA